MGDGTTLAHSANRVRQLLERGARTMDPVDRSLYLGFVIGDDRGQPPATIEAFRASGLAHLSAVSGRERGAPPGGGVAGRSAGPGRRPRWAATLALIGWFALLTRFEPSVLRASVMAALAATAVVAGRPSRPVRILGLTVTIVLLADPLLVHSVGWWLSVGATAGIVVLAAPLAARLPGPGPVRLPVAVTMAAQLGVAPVTIAVFGPLPLASVPANLLAVPAAAPIMLYGLPAGLLAGACPDPVAHLLQLPTVVPRPLRGPGGGRGGPAGRSRTWVGRASSRAAGRRRPGAPSGSAAPAVGSPLMRLALGDAEFDVTHRALVMGILNRTPDSFYDAGRYYDFDAFLAKAAAHVADGADFLDVGGVKAGPGDPVGEDEELERVVPAVEALVARFDLPISVDTWRSSVLDAALAAGASVGNDISGFADPDYLPVAAKHGASVVATHIRLAPRVPDPAPEYPEGVVEAVVRFCAERAAWAEAAGIPPGADHGRRRPRPREDRAACRSSCSGRPTGWPRSATRCSCRPPTSASSARCSACAVDERRLASVAAHAQGIALGCRVLRAHDVRGSRRVADVMAAILEAKGCGRSARG